MDQKNRCNDEVKNMIKNLGITQYEIAHRCGVTEWTLCRWLRYELSEEKKNLILSAIEQGGEPLDRDMEES